MRDEVVITIVIICLSVIILCMLALYVGVWPLQAAAIAGAAAATICVTGIILAIDLIIWIVKNK
jgi:hypothetical protein